MKCDALILGGGLGSRMGYQNKALVHFRGQSLFTYVLNTLLSLDLDGKIYLSLNQDIDVVAKLYPELEIFSDDVDLKQQGPLGGILSFYRLYGLQSQKVLICPCDTPFISGDLIKRLYHVLENHQGEDKALPSINKSIAYKLKSNHKTAAVCAESSNGLEPSIMLADSSKLGVVEQMLANHEKLSLRNLFAKLDGCSFYWSSTQDFYNINTLSELQNEGSL